MQGIKLIIWDMDGVKYPVTEVFKSNYIKAIAVAATKLIHGMEYEQAYALAKKSKEESNKTMKIFLEEYKLDALVLGPTAEANFDFSCVEQIPEFVEKLKQTDDVEHAIVTEGNRTWKNDILTQVLLAEFYAQRVCLTQEDFPGYSKRTSSVPCQMALDQTGYKAEESLIVEDTDENLIKQHEIGMDTVLIDPTGLKKQKHYINYIFPTPVAFLDYFKHERSKHLKL